jgi:hypothetical protein
MIMGAFLALAIVFAQLFQFQPKATSKKEAKTEQHQKTDDNATCYNVLPSFSLPSPAHIELDTKSFCLFEIRFEEESQEKYALDEPHYVGKFLQTLFSVIISPNAP